MRWQPSASIANLQYRAALMASIRAFFAARTVMEVETPLLSAATVTDPFLHSFALQSNDTATRYLQTSPEYAMKRLLAAGSGPIFQLTKSFRDDECGAKHNPEFTLLEWYQPNYSHYDLMQEVDEFLQEVAKTKPADKISYQQLWQNYYHINPHCVTLAELQTIIEHENMTIDPAIMRSLNTDDLLNLLLTHRIEKNLGLEKPVFIYDYPRTQAALARLVPNANETVAARFELYFHGIELANGFYELNDTEEQRQRFIMNNQQRRQLGLTEIPLDENFLAALAHGLPNCSGVALGVDRLLMILLNAKSINHVIAFDWQRA